MTTPTPTGVRDQNTAEPPPRLPLDEAAHAALHALHDAIYHQVGSHRPGFMVGRLPQGVWVAAAVLERALEDT